MDATNMLSQDHGIEREPSKNAHADGNQLRHLRELFERSASVMTPSGRGTIDSILSKYGVIRDEVERDPRIGLALSAEFAAIPIHPSFPVLPLDSVDPALARGLLDPVEDDTLHSSAVSQKDVTRDLMVDYISYLAQSAEPNSDDRCSSTDENSANVNDESEKHDTEDTDTAWDDPKVTHLDIYAGLSTDLFQAQVGIGYPVDETQAEKPAKEAVSSLENNPGQSLRPTGLTMSPILEIAVFGPQSAASSNRVAAHELAASSHDDHEAHRGAPLNSDATQRCRVASVARTEHISTAPSKYMSPQPRNHALDRSFQKTLHPTS
jgi:hypothetical protein